MVAHSLELFIAALRIAWGQFSAAIPAAPVLTSAILLAGAARVIAVPVAIATAAATLAARLLFASLDGVDFGFD